MHHIQLVTVSSDIITDGYYFTSARRFLIEIWRCLVDGEGKDVAVEERVREKKKFDYWDRN